MLFLGSYRLTFSDGGRVCDDDDAADGGDVHGQARKRRVAEGHTPQVPAGNERVRGCDIQAPARDRPEALLLPEPERSGSDPGKRRLAERAGR